MTHRNCCPHWFVDPHHAERGSEWTCGICARVWRIDKHHTVINGADVCCCAWKMKP